jgi:tetratricopeptide (TPR) repeat protein
VPSPFFAAVLLLTLILAGVRILLASAQRAMWRGDYDRTLLWLAPFGSLAEKSRALTLALAGRSKPAETIFRKRVDRARTPSARARELTLLADTLLNQDLFGQAKECLDQAMQLDIGHGGPCNEMASWYLRQGIEPQKALALVEQAIEAQKRALLQNPGLLLPSRLANKAWALALLGRPREAEAAIEQAIGMPNSKLAASRAFVCWTAGMAFAAMGEKAKAREHFEQARQVDPQGNYGKRAAAAL